MKILIHPGHNPDGKVACGAVGILKESTCARDIARIIKQIAPDVEVFSIEDGKSQTDVLNKIVEKINGEKCDLSISIHLNAASTNAAEGAEAYVWNPEDKSLLAVKVAERWLDYMGHLGYRNRGVKSGKTLRVINATNCPSVLLECGFVTNARDCQLFNAENIANAILAACGITPQNPAEPSDGTIYRVVSGAFRSKENATKHLDAIKKIAPDAYIKKGD